MTDAPVLEAVGISKSYGRVRAVVDVSFDVRPGEILGIVGDNGAGKSTLMNVVSGAIAPDSGHLRVTGRQLTPHTIGQARAAGIEMIYQDLGLSDNLSVVENVFLGREWTGGPAVLPVLRKKAMRVRTQAVLESLGIDLHDMNVLVEGLSGGQRQMVAIARALVAAHEPRVMVMDEPTAALGTSESRVVNDLIVRLRDTGYAVVVISHRIPELLELADRLLVMKGGRQVHHGPTRDLDVERCVQLIVRGTAALERSAG
ncbi:ATP-binding cassette domain-containing protein [Micromonospora sp. WMMD1128]|uniref:ATP-binding cassette domain-containing protein n=1 Tax=Micromonospora sp. WMMD1128 TaxID=3015150 RepID=UPI00248C6F63|nr:ATP-binding cassette domain-containing protein [Micromonospora sp. WMMD1128]WBB75941.1 ATP-binding cassette domain-containing protein [Micromonospora sp. WMMD1128]